MLSCGTQRTLARVSWASATHTLACAAATISGRASESRKAVARLIGKRRSVGSSGAGLSLKDRSPAPGARAEAVGRPAIRPAVERRSSAAGRPSAVPSSPAPGIRRGGGNWRGGDVMAVRGRSAGCVTSARAGWLRRT